MTEVPPFLFIVTSTALVLGVAIAVRGLIGFRPVAEVPALPTPAVSVSDTSSTDLAAGSSEADGSAAAGGVSTGPRDLMEPMVMTIAGVIIAIVALFTLSALINTA